MKILFSVFLGAVVGMIMMTLPEQETKRIEAFSPTMFFLILLPPIIFESGYNLVLFVVRRIFFILLLFLIFSTKAISFKISGLFWCLRYLAPRSVLSLLEEVKFYNLHSVPNSTLTKYICRSVPAGPRRCGLQT